MSCWRSADLHELLVGEGNPGTWTLAAGLDESLTIALKRLVSLESTGALHQKVFCLLDLQL